MVSGTSAAAPQVAATEVPRRRFVNILLGAGLVTSLSSFIYPILRYLVPPKLPDLGADATLAAKVAELRPNSAKTFRFGTRPGLLVQVAPGEYRAMSATCTHLGCTVQYRADLKEVWCACHNGIYDLNGHNVSGPPPRPLEQFEVQVRGDEIFVRRKQEA
ncbi:MAG: QcrA and Rieske domain-containing protein [Terriglobales bacterium]